MRPLGEAAIDIAGVVASAASCNDQMGKVVVVNSGFEFVINPTLHLPSLSKSRMG